jgi:hypothetical protein
VTVAVTEVGTGERLAVFLSSSISEFEVVDVPGAGRHAHRKAPEAFAELARRGLEPGARERGVSGE